MKNILFTAYSSDRFLDLYYLANELNSFKNINIIIYVNKKVFSINKQFIKESKIQIILDPEISIKTPVSTIKSLLAVRLNNKLIMSFKRIFLKTTILQLIREYRYHNYLLKKYNYFSEIIFSNNIDIIFATGDRHLHEESSILKAARDNNVKVVLPYLTSYGEYENMLSIRKMHNLRDSRNIYSYYMKNKFSKYLHKDFSFYPYHIMNALYKFGALSSNPWIMGNGISDIVCLDTKSQYNKYIGYKVDKKKLKIVGDIAYDILYSFYSRKAELSNLISKKYKLLKNKKNIVISLPQYYEHDYMSSEKSLNEIDFLLSSVAETRQNILISLHPKQKLDRYIFLEGKYECKIVSERLSYIMPIADVFISASSSVSIWAVMCGIKTITMNFYDLAIYGAKDLNSVKLVKDKSLFVNSINELLKKEVDFTSDWKELSRDEVFDKGVIKRYLEIINEL